MERHWIARWALVLFLLGGIQLPLVAQTPPVLIDTNLPSGNLSQAYRYTFQVVGGTAPFSWSVSNGNLPSGLSLDGTSGRLEGTPSATTVATFTVQVQDSNGQTASRTFNLIVTTSGFQLQPTAAELVLLQGRTASLQLQVIGQPQTNNPIGFSLLSALPAGVVASFEPALLSGGDSNVNFVAAADTSAAAGVYPLRVSGVSPPDSQYASFNLIVRPPPPEIAGFSPPGGLPGTSVTVRGTQLQTATAVTIGGLRAPFTASGPNQLQLSVPRGARTGRIVVVTPAGSATSATDFLVPTFALSLQPGVATAQPGSQVLLKLVTTGQVNNLVNLNVINLPDSWSAQFNPNYLDSQHRQANLLLQVPATSPLGNAAITVSAGIVQAAATVQVLTAPPRLTRLFPVQGPPGTVITLSGQNFQPGLRLRLGALELPIFSISSNRVQAQLPDGVASGRIQLVNPDGQTVSTSTVFAVLPRTGPPVLPPP